ncbi:MAG: hypothetical protein Q9165_008604 [Trypethelium subeluteriae]
MRKSFAAKRTPRKIGRDDDDSAAGTGEDAPKAPSSEPIVRRPGLSSKPKKSSSLRLSFGPDSKSTEPSQDDSDDVFAPKKSHLNRVTQDSKPHPLRTSLSSDHLPFRANTSSDQPSYSASYLAELHNSTPTRPAPSSSSDPTTTTTSSSPRALDIASKFGVAASVALASSHPSIPSDTEIREKKARRARLAQEQRADEYIGLGASDSSASGSEGEEEEEEEDDSDGNVVKRFKPESSRSTRRRKPESRLQREDEDVAEGYDELVEDGRVALGRRAEREEKVRRRREMEERIWEAEGGGVAGRDDGEGSEEEERDEEEVARHAAYEAAQTAAGAYGAPGTASSRRREEQLARERMKGPKKMTPVPELGAVLAKLREEVQRKGYARMMKSRELEELKKEQGEIAVEEVRIQQELKEAGRRYEELKAEAETQRQANGSGVTEMVKVERGLESFGSMPMAADGDSSDE